MSYDPCPFCGGVTFEETTKHPKYSKQVREYCRECSWNGPWRKAAEEEKS